MSSYCTQSADTSADVERIIIERYRTMSPADKLEIFRQLCRVTQELALVGLRRRYPDASPDELWVRLAETRLPRATVHKVLGPTGE